MLKIHSGVGKPCVGKTELVVRTVAMSRCDKEWHRIALRWVTHSCHPVEPDCKREPCKARSFFEPPTAAQLLFKSTKKPSCRSVKWLCETSTHTSRRKRLPHAFLFPTKTLLFGILLPNRFLVCLSCNQCCVGRHHFPRRSRMMQKGRRKKKGTKLPHEFVVHVTETPIQAMNEETGK